MAFSSAHLAQENRTHFPFASMFPRIFFLVFRRRDTGEVYLELSGTVCLSVNKECVGATGDVGDILGQLPRITPAK